jgi:hypothetical protein
VRATLKKLAIRASSRLAPQGSLAQRLTDLTLERDTFRQRLDQIDRAAAWAPQFVPPGHFYSAVPSMEDLRRLEPRLYDAPYRQPPGLDLREEAQLELLASFKPLYDEIEFPRDRDPKSRYHYNNPAYCYPDAFFLYAMIRHARPKRIIEVGSGYSSCLTLDTNERFFDSSIRCAFVEPYPKLLRELVRPDDKLDVIERGLEQVPLELFHELAANDVLFIDSTLVVRVGSDVNYLFFSVLPALASGTYVHLHDIFYPFEYPLQWLREGRQWAELYLLRAFLMYNSAFEVVLMNTFLLDNHPALMREKFPMCCAEPFGSIWLRKI